MVGAAVKAYVADTDESLWCGERGGDDVQFGRAHGAPDRRPVSRVLVFYGNKANIMMGAGSAQPATTTWAVLLEDMSATPGRTLKHDDAMQLWWMGSRGH